MQRVLLLAVFALCACSSNDDDTGDPTGSSTTPGTGHATSCGAEQDRTGEATYYDFADGSGACSYEATPNDLMIGAMNAPDYLGSEACGSCATLDGPNGSITIRIVDLCPECPSGNIDLSPMAFSQIAALEQGRVPITWRYVQCGVTGPVRYRFKDGSNQWWTAVQVRNHNHAIAKFEYEKDGAFVEVVREDYNYFVEPNGMGPGPYTFRVTDVYGNVVTDSGIPLGDSTTADGASQFPTCAP